MSTRGPGAGASGDGGRHATWDRTRSRAASGTAADALDDGPLTPPTSRTPGCGVDIAESGVVFVVLLAVITFMVIIGIPFLIALGELLLVVVLALGGVVARTLFRRPWTVDAMGPDGQHQQGGWSDGARAGRRDASSRTGSLPPVSSPPTRS